MTIQITKCDDAIVIEGEMSIYFATEMKEQLLSALRAGGDVVLDLAQVSEMDTCGLQMLLMARAIAADTGSAFSLKTPSAAVVDVLRLCGLQDLLGAVTRRAA